MIFHLLRDFIRSLGRREKEVIEVEVNEFEDWDREFEKQTKKILLIDGDKLRVLTIEEQVARQVARFNSMIYNMANPYSAGLVQSSYQQLLAPGLLNSLPGNQTYLNPFQSLVDQQDKNAQLAKFAALAGISDPTRKM